MRAMGTDLAVPVYLLQDVAGPCNHSEPGALCNYD